MDRLPSHAQAIVIGGGIVGSSTAYHLAKLGYRDVVLLERHQLTSGSTWHAAGLVGQLRSQAGITQLLGNSISLYNRLEEETGIATGWKMNGGLRLACNPARLIEIKRQATTARSFGLEMHVLTPQEARDLWPLMDVSDVLGAAFYPLMVRRILLILGAPWQKEQKTTACRYLRTWRSKASAFKRVACGCGYRERFN